MNHFKNTFIKGLITILPLVATCYFIYWLVVGTETIVEKAIGAILPSSFYVPGLGLIIVFAGTYVIGLVTSVWLGRKLVALWEHILGKVPLVKTIYSSIKDLLSYFDVSNENKLNKPVIVYVETLDAHMLGFVTQDTLAKLPSFFQEEGHDNRIAVYLPMSYQVGGFMIFVTSDLISPLDMSIEEAMQYVITAGVSGRQASKS